MSNGNGNIIRKHTKDKDFTIIDNNIFKNTELSLKAKGLLTMMLSFVDDWEFSINGLAALSTDGVASVRSGLDELEEKGYLKRENAKRVQGQFAKTIYHIYETPTVCEKPTRINRHGKTDTEKPTRKIAYNKELNNKGLNNKELNNKHKCDTFECEVQLPMKDGSLYSLDDDYYNDLISLHRKTIVDSELLKMKIWLNSNPSRLKTKTGMKRFITNWLNRDDKPKQAKPKEVKPVDPIEEELSEVEIEQINKQWEEAKKKYGKDS